MNEPRNSLQHAVFQARQATRNPATNFFVRFFARNSTQLYFLYSVKSKTIWHESARIGTNLHQLAPIGPNWAVSARSGTFRADLVRLATVLGSSFTRYSSENLTDKVDFEVGMRKMSKMIMKAGMDILAMPEATRNAIGIGVGGLLVVLAMGAGVLLARRYYVRSQGECEQGGLGIDDLQRIYDAGLLTQEEFSRLRRVAMGLEETGVKNPESSSRPPAKVDDVNRDNEDTSSAYSTEE